MALLLTIVIFWLFILLAVVYYVVPALLQHKRLVKEYRNISFLSLSSIPFVGNIHLIDKRPDVFFQFLCQLAKQAQDKNKDLFCLWYSLWPMVFICSGQGLESFINNAKQSVKSFDYTFLEPWLKTGLLTSNHEKWRSRRRLLTPAFHDSQLLHSFMLTFNEQSHILARRLDEYVEQGNITHDLYPCISACTLDIIAGLLQSIFQNIPMKTLWNICLLLEAATGTHPNAQQHEGENEIVKATVRITDITNQRMRSPWLWPSFIFNLLPIGREHNELLKILHGFSRKVIEERLATFNSENTTDKSEEKKSKRRLVFLDSLIAQMQKEKLSFEDVQEEVDTFMFEGHDTTAAAINFCCYLVGCYPDVQAKIHAEMDSIFGDDRERACTEEDIEQMTYLECVIKESMRVLAPVPFIIREAQEDFVSHGHTIRKGTAVYIFIHAIHYDESVFPNPEKFDPERYANQDLITSERSHFAYIPFSAGSRNCIGQRFAVLEERVVLSTLFRRFSFRSSQTIDELHLAAEAILRPTASIQMIVERR